MHIQDADLTGYVDVVVQGEDAGHPDVRIRPEAVREMIVDLQAQAHWGRCIKALHLHPTSLRLSGCI